LASIFHTLLTSVITRNLPVKQIPLGSLKPVAKSVAVSPSSTLTTPSPGLSGVFMTVMNQRPPNPRVTLSGRVPTGIVLVGLRSSAACAGRANVSRASSGSTFMDRASFGKA
jgi:hypothetical protein